MELLDDRMHDGSRNFLLLPVGSTPPIRLLFRVFTLWGAYPTAYIPSLSESWIDFKYRKHCFSINNQNGDFWFFVKDPECSNDLVREVAEHFRAVLDGNP